MTSWSLGMNISVWYRASEHKFLQIGTAVSKMLSGQRTYKLHILAPKHKTSKSISDRVASHVCVERMREIVIMQLAGLLGIWRPLGAFPCNKIKVGLWRFTLTIVDRPRSWWCVFRGLVKTDEQTNGQNVQRTFWHHTPMLINNYQHHHSTSSGKRQNDQLVAKVVIELDFETCQQ